MIFSTRSSQNWYHIPDDDDGDYGGGGSGGGDCYQTKPNHFSDFLHV